MANILYGVNGEGSGHSTRAKEVIAHLQQAGHQVHVVSFDRGLRNLSSSCDVTEIFGFRITYVNNQVRYRRTLAKNLIKAPRAARSVADLLRRMNDWGIDLVITDFEPLSCHAGRRKQVPVISIDNQHCLTNVEVSWPLKYRRDATAARLVTQLMTPRASVYLVTSFFAARVRKRNTFLFPPILRKEILEAKPYAGSDVLVYVTSPSRDLVRMLKHVRCRFLAYGFDRDGQEGNVVFKKPSMDGFLNDLAGCKAIIWANLTWQSRWSISSNRSSTLIICRRPDTARGGKSSTASASNPSSSTWATSAKLCARIRATAIRRCWGSWMS